MKLRIATWNLERPRSDQAEKLAMLEAKMESIHADIWILTETHAGAKPGQGFSCVATKTIHNGRAHTAGEKRVTIWSRLSILSEIPTHDQETAVCSQISTPAGNILVYGTIIPYGGAATKYPYRSAEADQSGKSTWQLHSESILRHEADWKRIISEHQHLCCCVGGDFNQNRDGSRWYGNNRVRQQLTDSLRACGLSCVTEEDFRASGKLYSRANIDHLCVSEPFSDAVLAVGAWEACEINGKRLTDHNGVWIDLSLTLN